MTILDLERFVESRATLKYLKVRGCGFKGIEDYPLQNLYKKFTHLRRPAYEGFRKYVNLLDASGMERNGSSGEQISIYSSPRI